MLKKMYNIDVKPGKHNPRILESQLPPSHGTLNAYQRKRRDQEMRDMNMKILKKIHYAPTSYPPSTIASEADLQSTYRSQILSNNKRFEKNFYFVTPREERDQGSNVVRMHWFSEEQQPGTRPGSAFRSTKTLNWESPKRPQTAKRKSVSMKF